MDLEDPKASVELDLDQAVWPRADPGVDLAVVVALHADHLTGAGLDESRLNRPGAPSSPELVGSEGAGRTQLLVEADQLEIVPDVHLDHRPVRTHDIDLPPPTVASSLQNPPIADQLQSNDLGVHRGGLPVKLNHDHGHSDSGE